MNWLNECGEQRGEARRLMSPGTALCLSKMGDQLLASADMQWHLFFPSSPPYIFQEQHEKWHSRFWNTNYATWPWEGWYSLMPMGTKTSWFISLAFSFTFFCHLLHSFTHLWTDQMDPKKLFCSTSTNFLLMELAVLSHETFLMKSHSMNCIYVNSSFPSGKSFLLFYSPD